MFELPIYRVFQMKRLTSALLTIALAASVQITPQLLVKSSIAASSFPACDDSKVIKKLVKRFNQTEKIYWKERDLLLTGLSDIHFHADYQLPDSLHDRRFCHGSAEFDSGRTHRIHYLIESNAGFAGFSWNVEYCIHGLDPYRYYDGDCRHLSRKSANKFP